MEKDHGKLWTALNLFHYYNKSYSILEIMKMDISSKNVPHFSGLSFQTGFIFHHYVM